MTISGMSKRYPVQIAVGNLIEIASNQRLRAGQFLRTGRCLCREAALRISF